MLSRQFRTFSSKISRRRPPITRGRSASMRRIVSAIFCVLRNGVTWRALPLDFPPWQTAYYWFRRFVRAGGRASLPHHDLVVERSGGFDLAQRILRIQSRRVDDREAFRRPRGCFRVQSVFRRRLRSTPAMPRR
jgi:transposase